MTPTKPEPLPRRGRLVRAPDRRHRLPPATVEHGEAILRLLDAHLFLTNDQIETALFRHGTTATGKPRSPRGAAYAANTALRRLFDAGYLDRVPAFLPGTTPRAVTAHYLNVLSGSGARAAAALLTAEGRTPRWRRSLLPHPWQPLLHGYWIRQFAVAGCAAAQAAGYRWWSWFDDRQLAALKKEHGARFVTVPDGFFVITHPATGRDFPHFLEIDLGTETVAARSPRGLDWRGKVDGYLAYFDRDFREQFGLTTLPLVLTVTESERRLAHLLAATAAAGGGGRFWFTTRTALYPPPSANGPPAARDAPFWGSIWRVPHENGLRSLAGRCGALGASAPVGAGRPGEGGADDAQRR